MSRWKNNQEGQERAAHISHAGGSASLLRGSLLACLSAVLYCLTTKNSGFLSTCMWHLHSQKEKGGSKSEKS